MASQAAASRPSLPAQSCAGWRAARQTATGMVTCEGGLAVGGGDGDGLVVAGGFIGACVDGGLAV
jgi:hypothetical protein